MNIIDILLYSYSRLYVGKFSLILSPIRRIIRTIVHNIVPSRLVSEQIIKNQKKSDIIVSLTSFPGRINDVHLVIRCLLRQTLLPKKIILWLSRNQFAGIELPINLTKLESDLFEIRFVEGDLRSHKKYIYALTEFEDSWILLVDDDLYYPSDMLQILVDYKEKYPNSVICRYGNIIKHDVNGDILPYVTWFPWWKYVIHFSDNPNFFFGTGGGVLLKKSLLYKDTTNIELATSLTPLADDVWINAMVNIAGTKKIKVPFGILLGIRHGQEEALSKINVGENKNDEQINNVVNYYKGTMGVNPFASRNF